MKTEKTNNKTTQKSTSTKEKETKVSTNSKKEVIKTTKPSTEKKAKKNVETKVVEKVIEKEEIKQSDERVKSKPAKKNKLIDLFLILGLAVVLVLGFLVLNNAKVDPLYELPLTLSGEAGLHQLTYNEYQEKINNNEHFVVILERASCPHCVTFIPVAEQFASDNNVPMYYVDTDTFSSEDWSGFQASNSFLRKANGNWGTPTTLVLVGSETVDYIQGATTADNLVQLYNTYFGTMLLSSEIE